MAYFHLQEAMRNILLLFAKLNPAIRYVQGMNEILAPIFYVFCTDTDEQNAVRQVFSVKYYYTFLPEIIGYYFKQD